MILGEAPECRNFFVAAGFNSIGIASYCWHCSLMPVKVLGADGTGTTANVAAGIVWATDHGARVISMSLSGTTGTSALLSAVQYAHSQGVVLVAAAGNSGTATQTYPAAYPEVLGVAGSDPNDALYAWSNYGPWVKVAAPGCSYTTGRAGWFGSFCGTSAAAYERREKLLNSTLAAETFAERGDSLAGRLAAAIGARLADLRDKADGDDDEPS